jgi:hypothetical protein
MFAPPRERERERERERGREREREREHSKYNEQIKTMLRMAKMLITLHSDDCINSFSFSM